MKAYPSIGTEFDPGVSYHVFDKLDGSNLRAEWSAGRGFYKFGSRTQLITPDQAALFPAIELIHDILGAEMGRRFSDRKWLRAIAYVEYVGPQSFAGSHHDKPCDMSVSLIDVDAYKRGILPPEEFLPLVEGLPHARLLHRGRVDQEFVQSVRDGTLCGMTFEGIIGKGPFLRTLGGPAMFKAKSQAWLTKLRTVCAGDQALFDRLS